MALVKIAPTEAHVDWDRLHGRPRQIRWRGQHLRVVGLNAVRSELSAYPADRGPRITYLLETDGGGQASLVFDGWRRRWYVEGLEAAA